MRASATGEVLFSRLQRACLSASGEAGEGFVDSLRILDGGRISIAALSIGIAQGAFERGAKYSKQRKQFGRFISEFQSHSGQACEHGNVDRSCALAYLLRRQRVKIQASG